MKLASLNQGRDGQLVVVSDDNTRYLPAYQSLTLQAALDDWQRYQSSLQSLSQQLNGDTNLGKPCSEAQFAAPLPRAYQWLDGSAYVNHIELVRKARGAEMPDSFWQDPLMYQGNSDTFLSSTDDIAGFDESWGIDLEAEIAVIVDDVPMGASLSQCEQAIRLIALVNDVSLRNLIPAELAKGFGFVQSKPSTAFAPFVVTPDSLGEGWRDAKVHLPVTVEVNGEQLGAPNAGVDMTFNFAQLIQHATKSRALCAGTIIGSGTVSNVDLRTGSACLAEKRMIEIIDSGEPKTSFLKHNDNISIDVHTDAGDSLFGAIKQRVVIS